MTHLLYQLDLTQEQYEAIMQLQSIFINNPITSTKSSNIPNLGKFLENSDNLENRDILHENLSMTIASIRVALHANYWEELSNTTLHDYFQSLVQPLELALEAYKKIFEDFIKD